MSEVKVRKHLRRTPMTPHSTPRQRRLSVGDIRREGVKVVDVLFQPDKLIYEYNTGELVVFDQHDGSYAYKPYKGRGKVIDHTAFERDHPELAHAMHDYNDTYCKECGKYRPDDDRVKAGMKCGFCAYGG